MEISQSSTWMDTIIHLAETHFYASESDFEIVMDGVKEVVKKNSMANSRFGYLLFDASVDAEMKLSEIAAVFTQDDFGEMVDEIIHKPAMMARSFLEIASENEALGERMEDPENRRKFLEMGMKALSVEIGSVPEDTENDKPVKTVAP